MPPAPKRSSQRRRRNKESAPEKVSASGPVVMPEPDAEWHPVARDWFLSLADSGQSQFFEPSDWQAARYVAMEMTRHLGRSQPSANLFTAIWSAMGDLLTTEASRRRVRLEVERQPAVDDADVPKLDDYRARLLSG